MVDAKYEQKGMHNIACVLCTNFTYKIRGLNGAMVWCTARLGAQQLQGQTIECM